MNDIGVTIEMLNHTSLIETEVPSVEFGNFIDQQDLEQRLNWRKTQHSSESPHKLDSKIILKMVLKPIGDLVCRWKISNKEDLL